MNLKSKTLSGWDEIIDNPKNLPIDLLSVENNLTDYFRKELERIKTDYYSDEYFNNHSFLKNFIDDIPGKLNKLQLSIRPFIDDFHSCIITDEEVDILAGYEHYRWVKEMHSDGWIYGETLDTEEKTHPDLTQFTNLEMKRQRFYRKLIYTIPVILNRCKLEVFKPEEQAYIKPELIENLARVIHERYRVLMREMEEKSKTESVYEKLYIVNAYNRQYFSLEFDKLPNDIKSSNFDSAYHIATKLLSIGYSITEADRNTKLSLLFLSDTEIETMAKLEHERWAWEKRLKGFTYGEIRNDAIKKHPCLVPYYQLPELEKEKDRVLVKFYPSLLHDINYTVIALTPEQLKNISYIPRQRVLLQESLADIENIIFTISTGEKQDGEEKKNEIESVLRECIYNIQSSIEEQYAASLVQQCILPTRIFFRSCLPNSFILFKPKDILSGDFFFISKINNLVIYAAADCTGHGTAGAMLSMICSNFLDQAVNDNRLSDPSTIIDFVYKKLVAFMKRNDDGIISNFGMEIAVCTIIPETRTVFYAGINRPLYIFRNHHLEVLEPQKIKAGDGFESIGNTFKTSQQLNLQNGDTLYTFSDGYADQFGGSENKKFLSKNLKILLESIQTKSMLEQYEILNKTIELWKGTGTAQAVDQVDDILIIGVRV